MPETIISMDIIIPVTFWLIVAIGLAIAVSWAIREIDRLKEE